MKIRKSSCRGVAFFLTLSGAVAFPAFSVDDRCPQEDALVYRFASQSRILLQVAVHLRPSWPGGSRLEPIQVLLALVR